MEYSADIIINRPIDTVIEKFDSFDNMKEWQPELQSYEHLSGTPGQPGAKTKLVYMHGKRRTEMIETVFVRDLPREFSGQYETKGVRNELSNHFEDMGDGNTKWTVNSKFIFSGLMKYVAWMMKGSFRKMTMKFMQNFKSFVERTTEEQ